MKKKGGAHLACAGLLERPLLHIVDGNHPFAILLGFFEFGLLWPKKVGQILINFVYGKINFGYAMKKKMLLKNVFWPLPRSERVLRTTSRGA